MPRVTFLPSIQISRRCRLMLSRYCCPVRAGMVLLASYALTASLFISCGHAVSADTGVAAKKVKVGLKPEIGGAKYLVVMNRAGVQCRNDPSGIQDMHPVGEMAEPGRVLLH